MRTFHSSFHQCADANACRTAWAFGPEVVDAAQRHVAWIHAHGADEPKPLAVNFEVADHEFRVDRCGTVESVR